MLHECDPCHPGRDANGEEPQLKRLLASVAVIGALTAGSVACTSATLALATTSPTPATIQVAPPAPANPDTAVTCGAPRAIAWPPSATHILWVSGTSPYMAQFSSTKNATLWCPETKSDGSFTLYQYGTSRCFERDPAGADDTWNEGSCATSNLHSDLLVAFHSSGNYYTVEALDGFGFCLYYNGNNQNAYGRACGTGTVANEQLDYYYDIPGAAPQATLTAARIPASGCVPAVVHGADVTAQTQWIRVTHACTGITVRIKGWCNFQALGWQTGAAVQALGTHSTIKCPDGGTDAFWMDNDFDLPAYVYWYYHVGTTWYPLGNGLT